MTENTSKNSLNYTLATSNEEPSLLFDGRTIEDNTVPINDFFTSREDLNRGNKLEQAKNDKLSALSNINNKVDLDDSYTDMGNGWLESNRNKIWNEETAQGIQSLNQYTDEKYALTRDPKTGRTYFKDGTEYVGRTRRLYRYGTKDWLDDVIKVGLARGDMDSSDARYLKDKFKLGYGWDSGEKGVDINQKQSDVLLPADVATMREAVTHGRKEALEGRVLKDRFADPFTYDAYGSGASEYYKNLAALYGDPQEYDPELGEAAFNKYMDRLSPRHRRGSYTSYEGGYDPTLRDTSAFGDALEVIGDKVANTLAAFGSTFVNELIIKPADALGDLTGYYDLGTEEELTASVNQAFGYDDTNLQASMENIGAYWDIVNNKEASVTDRVRAAGNGILEAFTTPEMLGTSLGALISWVAPGSLLKAVGVGSKFTQASKALDAAVEAGQMTRSAARLQKAKNFMSIDGAKEFVTRQSGFIASSMGNVNAQYDQFVKNNNGVELTGEDKAKWFAGRFAVQMLNQNIDKIVDFNIIKSPGLFAAAIPAVKAMTQAEFGRFIGVMATGMTKTALNMGSEAAQEYSQSMMELYNARYGSEQFKDLDTFMKFLASPEHVREGGIAALAGAGGAGQFELVGTVRPMIGGLASGLNAVIPQQQRLPEPVAPEEATEDEVRTAKANYGEILIRARTYVAENGISEQNIGNVLDDLDELNATKYIISTSPEEQQIAGEEAYDSIVSALKTFVENNPDLKLSRKIVSKTIEESKADKEKVDVDAAADSTPESIKSAFSALATVLGDGETRDYIPSSTFIINKFKNASYTDIVSEEGTIDDELRGLEAVLTGKTSETLEETFDVLQEQLSGKTPSSFVAEKKTEEGTILGSAPNTSQEPINIWAGSSENTALSNLAPRPFNFDGVEYKSVEHAYQTLKSGEFDGATYSDARWETQGKVTGRKGVNKAISLDLMKNLIRTSLEQNPDFAEKLLATGDREITHNSPRGKTDIWTKNFPKILKELREELKGPQTTTEEVEYDDFTRRADAERIYNVLYGSKEAANFSEEFKETLNRFAIANGVSRERIDYIRKSYESVDEEALQGATGYVARISRLKGLLQSSNPNTKEINKEHKKILDMQASIINSAKQLTAGIKAAKQEAAKRNKSPLVPGKSYSSPTEYKQYNYRTKKYDKDFNIWVSKVDGKWIARTEEAEKRLASKQAYIKDINTELRAINSRFSGKVKGFEANIGKFIVPVKEGKHKKVRQADAKYIDSSLDVIEEIVPDNVGVTKVILGEKTHDKWNPKGEYHKANALIINNDDFTENDVVIIDSIGLTKKSKEGKPDFYVPAFGKEAKKSIKAASDAGATFILDHSFFSDKNSLRAAAITGFFNRSLGYTLLEDKGRTILVKETAETKKAIRQRKVQMDADKKTAEEKTKNKSSLVTAYRALELEIDPVDGSELTRARKKDLEDEIKKLYPLVAKKSFKDDEAKLDRYLENQLNTAARDEATEILKDPDPDPLDYKDKAFQAQVEAIIAAEEDKDLAGQIILEKWAKITNSDASRKEKNAAINKLLEEYNLSPEALSDAILTVRSFSKGKKDLYEQIFTRVSTNQEHISPLRKRPTEEKYKELVETNNSKRGHIFDGKKHIFNGIRRVVQDASKLVNVSKITVANSIPVEYLPFVVREATKDFSKQALKELASVSEPELAEQTDLRDKYGYVKGNLYLHNSPARGIIFNKDGEVNPEVMTAMYLSLGEMVRTDRNSLIRGFKSDIDVAKMFGVQEFEVTTDMRKFAFQHGALLKTAASSMGKGILAQLGMTKKSDANISSHEYEALVADLGNSALIIAEGAGLLEAEPVFSNDLAKFYRDGETRSVDTQTYFVHLKDKQDKSGQYTKNVPIKKVETFIEGYKEYAENLPGVQTERKEPSFRPPSKERLEKAKTEVRNDITNLSVPEQAKTTIDQLMNTAYSFDLARVNEFLDAVDAEDSNVMKLLGYVDLESDDFKKLYQKDKDTQKSKNNDILSSIENLRLLRDKVVAENRGESPSIYFDYFYSSNDRYMLDSNTVNPQVDKIHRFLITPKEHMLEYDIAKNDKGGYLFSVDGQDQSFVVRMAIVQGLGGDVDKMDAMDIIKFGDTMLSMSPNQLVEARAEMLRTGKANIKSADGVITVSSQGTIESDTESTTEVKEYAADGSHITHALHVFDFLNKVQTAKNSKMRSSLSLEFDSLTSGFANKIQQMPILKDMHLHFARVGILIPQYLRELEEDPNFKGEGKVFDPSQGHGINDVLANNFFDSYKTMAKVTLEMLQEGTKQKENLSQPSKKNGRSGRTVFEIIKPMLPGGDVLSVKGAAIEISKALRNMFKDPFMIFNYSASIARIVKNLSNNVANDIARGIATADFTDPEQAEIKEIAKQLLKVTPLELTKTKEKITTPAALQQALLDHKLSDLKLSAPLKVHNPVLQMKLSPARNFETLLETIVSLTYGEAVKEVFETSFEPFITMQEAINDSFKVAFRIFDKKRIDKLKSIQQSKKDYFLSMEDHAKVLEELWDDFPWIVGPLSGAASKKDVISVVTTSTRTPNAIETSRKKPQTVLADGKTTMTRTVSPLVRYLEEAVSAGSVLPFHAIDGAEMSELINGMQQHLNAPSIAAIHDAIIVPLNKSDIAGFTYQKGMASINTDYVLVDALAEMADRLETTILAKDFDTEYKDVGVSGIKKAKKKDTFPQGAKRALKNLRKQIKTVKDAREKYYGDDGILKDAWYGNLVGTPGSMYNVNMTSPDLSYRENFKPFYTAVEAVQQTSQLNVAPVLKNVKLNVLREMAKRLSLPTNLKKAETIAEISTVLEENPSKLEAITEYFEERAAKMQQSETAVRINDMVNNLSALVAGDPTVNVDPMTIDENSTDAESKAAIINIVEENLNSCESKK